MLERHLNRIAEVKRQQLLVPGQMDLKLLIAEVELHRIQCG
jgi:hypothetical protein